MKDGEIFEMPGQDPREKEIYQQFEWLQADMNENSSNYHREIQHNPVYFQRFRDLLDRFLLGGSTI